MPPPVFWRPIQQECCNNRLNQQECIVATETIGMKASAAAIAASQGREARRLSTLLEVSQALSGTLNLKSALHRVLEVLAKHHGAIRSMVTMLRDGGELFVEASDGLDRPAQAVHYRMGEGITGRVVETSKPVVVRRGGPMGMSRSSASSACRFR